MCGAEYEASESLLRAAEYLNQHSRWALDDADVIQFTESLGGKRSSTFGHATIAGAASIVQEWHRRGKQGHFVDLGSGNGHVVLFAALIDTASTFLGIELATSRVDVARAALKHLDSEFPEMRLESRVAFANGDMLKTDLTKADAVFVSSLALGDSLRSALAAKLIAECRSGTVRRLLLSRRP